ncbi:MAG: M48 family metallopeptidase [Candidatus Woesearchaeota archaeon]
MQTAYERISANKRATFILIILFVIIVAALGLAIGAFFNNPIFGLSIAAMLSIALTLFSFYDGDSAVLSLSNARPATKKEFPYLVNTVEGLSIAAGIQVPKIYVIEENSINAFATGRDPKHASITVTTGATKKLNRAELEGVVGHEMSHIKNYDIRLMMLVVVLVGITALLSDLILRTLIYGKGNQSREKGNGAAIFLVVGLVLAILSPIIAQLIKLAVSRKREFLADADGAMLTRHPKGLADALKKIKNDDDKIVDAANKATAHLFIENPLRQHEGWVNSLFETHPPIDQRIKALNAM